MHGDSDRRYLTGKHHVVGSHCPHRYSFPILSHSSTRHVWVHLLVPQGRPVAALFSQTLGLTISSRLTCEAAAGSNIMSAWVSGVSPLFLLPRGQAIPTDIDV